MKIALVIAEKPKTDKPAEDQRTWQDFLVHIQRAEWRPKDTETLTENVWQIPLDTGLLTLSRLSLQAMGDGISIRVLFLDDYPEWKLYPPRDQ